MKKIFLSTILIFSILIPSTTFALSQSSKYLPEDTVFFMNFNLSEFGDYISKLLDEELSSEIEYTSDETEAAAKKDLIKAIKKQIYKDSSLSIQLSSGLNDPAIIVGTDLAEGTLDLLKNVVDYLCVEEEMNSCYKFEKNKAEEMADDYQAIYGINLNDSHLLFSQLMEPIKNAEDVANEKEGAKGLEDSTDFLTTVNKLDRDSLFLMYADYKNLLLKVGELTGDDEEMKLLLEQDIIKIMGSVGLSVKKTANTIVLKSAVTGDKKVMDEKNIYFDELVTPIDFKLYKQLPESPVILYAEQGNIFNAINLYLDYFENLSKNDSYNYGYDNDFTDVYEDIKNEIGFTLEDSKKTFNKNIAFAVQSNGDIPIPYVSVLAEINSAEKESAKKISNGLNSFFDKYIKMANEEDENVNIKHEKVRDNLYKISLDASLSKMFFKEMAYGFVSEYQNVEMQDFDNYLDGRIPNLEIYYGMLTDQTFVFTNDARLLDHSTKKLNTENDLALSITKENGYNGSFGYVNLDNLKSYIKKIVSGIKKDTPFVPTLEFYEDYYKVLEFLSYVPKLLSFSKTDKYTSDSKIVINFSTDVQESYEKFISGYKTQDSDGDGLADFDEEYIHYTNPYKADSDGDEINDKEEIEAGTSPTQASQSFKDIYGDEWYSQYVLRLNNKGSIKGYYKDGNLVFDGGKLVNRAEFTKMVLEAFDIPLSTSFYYNAFDDVDQNEWYAPYANAAYNEGIVTGKFDEGLFTRRFEGAAPISRAEALVIISRAAGLSRIAPGCIKLNPSYSSNNYSGGFINSGSYPIAMAVASDRRGQSMCNGEETTIYYSDINSGDYFIDFIPAAFELGIMQGNNEMFRPNDPLTRAEAAKIIARTLEAKINHQSQDTSTITEDLEQGLSSVPYMLYGF